MGLLHECIYDQVSCHMVISDEGVGNLINRVVCEPIEDIGSLNEDRGNVMVGVP